MANNNNDAPDTLLEAVQYFADPDIALAFVANLRWPNGPVCPRCEAKESAYLKTRRLWKCKGCQKQFSVKVGTIFEDSPISLSKWLPAMWMLVNCKNGISSYELARAIGVTQKSAWFMLHRIRAAMQAQSFTKFKGEVEIDETYVGGRVKFMNQARRARTKGTHWGGKTAVMGILERNPERGQSNVRTCIIQGTKRRTLLGHMKENIEIGSQIFTDALPSYASLNAIFVHRYIDHSTSYGIGRVHTNSLENFWSLLKRTIKGTYVSVEPFHLFRYLDEQCFRFNNRKDTDRNRFMHAVASILHKRLTYAVLTGKNLPQTC